MLRFQAGAIGGRLQRASGENEAQATAQQQPQQSAERQPAIGEALAQSRCRGGRDCGHGARWQGEVWPHRDPFRAGGSRSPGHSDNSDNSDSRDSPDYLNHSDHSDKSDKSDHSDHSDKSDKSDNSDHSDHSDRWRSLTF